jgi:hypothetical protein
VIECDRHFRLQFPLFPKKGSVFRAWGVGGPSPRLSKGSEDGVGSLPYSG